MLDIGSGLVSGIITAMGMGGGTILILLLSLFLGINQTAAQAVNLVFFIPTSITSIFMNIRYKNIEYNIGIKLAIFGVLGAIIGAKILSIIDVYMLKKIFGIFLLIIAIYESYGFYIQYITLKERNNKTKIREEDF